MNISSTITVHKPTVEEGTHNNRITITAKKLYNNCFASVFHSEMVSSTVCVMRMVCACVYVPAWAPEYHGCHGVQAIAPKVAVMLQT